MRSSSDFTRTDPSGNGMTLRSRVCSSSATVPLPCVRFAYALLACSKRTWIMFAWIYGSRRSLWILPSVYMYYCSNYCNTSIVVSLTLSLISSRSPYVNTIDMPLLIILMFLPLSKKLFPSMPLQGERNALLLTTASFMSWQLLLICVLWGWLFAFFGILSFFLCQCLCNALFFHPFFLCNYLSSNFLFLLLSQGTHGLLSCILSLLRSRALSTFASSHIKPHGFVPLCWPLPDYLLYIHLRYQIWKLVPYVLWVLPRSDRHTVEISLELRVGS